MINLSVETWLRFLIWIVIGFMIYFTYSRRHSKLGQPGYQGIRAAGHAARTKRHTNAHHPQPRAAEHAGRGSSMNGCGPCRDRTDDIHGVNVALYQLS